jgi:integrase
MCTRTTTVSNGKVRRFEKLAFTNQCVTVIWMHSSASSGRRGPSPAVLNTDLRRTFATRLRANGVHEYDIQDLLGHAKPGVTKVYARATIATLEAAVAKLTQPWGEVIEFERKAS